MDSGVITAKGLISVTQTLASMVELVKTSTAVPGANVIRDTMGHIVMKNTFVM